MNLNVEQLAAIGSRAATKKVIAGPGSGKSRALVGRIKKLLDEGLNPQEIIVLTFTNNAAHVFSERLTPVRLRYMGTVHGFCMRLIQKYGHFLGYRPGSVSLVTETAKQLLLDTIRQRLGKKISDKELVAEATPDAKLIWAEYRHQIKRANMVDYDQILADGLELLRIEEVNNHLKPIAELLGDELQDSGPADWGVIWAIPADKRFLVGDPDQSIFEFRGGDPTIFIHADQPEPCQEFELTMNYRSDIAICEAANKLIAHNFNRIPKRIVPVSEEMGLIELRTYNEEGEEIYGVWSQICELKQHGIAYDEIAILSRTNHIVERYRETLRGLGVPIKHASIHLPSDWRFVFTCLNAMIDPDNDLHIEAMMLARGRSVTEISRLKLEALAKGTTLRGAAGLIDLSRATPIEALRNLVLIGASQESCQLVRHRIDILPEDSTLPDLLTDLWRTDNWIAKEEGAGVTVTTVHRAKGGEWDGVFLVGLEETVFPHYSPTMDPGQDMIEEERRLAFVGVTRARHRLFISHVRQRMAFFKTRQNEPSRFIKEMGL